MTYNCVDRAIEMFLQRAEKDTNPMIVQMVNSLTKRVIAHWYYRSDQYIFQPEDLSSNLPITSYIGKPSNAPQEIYGQGTFKIDFEIVREAKKLVRMKKSHVPVEVC